MAKARTEYSAQTYLLEDHVRTLFPLNITRVVVSGALPEIQQPIQEILDPKTSDAFLVQQRCYARAEGWATSRFCCAIARIDRAAKKGFCPSTIATARLSMAAIYRSRVEELAGALQREDTRLEASEMLRGLIDSIVLMPQAGQLRIELRGNLAAMLTAAHKRKGRRAGDLHVPIQLVAGAHPRLHRRLCWTAA